MSKEDIGDIIPELRKTAREKYLKDRETQQMNLYKKVLDDQKKLTTDQAAGDSKDAKASLVSLLLDKTKTGSDFQTISDIEKRQIELDEKLYELANKHRQNF